jgi:hypothetical protein
MSKELETKVPEFLWSKATSRHAVKRDGFVRIAPFT